MASDGPPEGAPPTNEPSAPAAAPSPPTPPPTDANSAAAGAPGASVPTPPSPSPTRSAPEPPPPSTPPPAQPPPPPPPPQSLRDLILLRLGASGSGAKEGDDSAWFRTINIAMGIGFLTIVVYSLSQKPSLSILGCALLIALAATLVGTFIGFIFGIPKTVTTTGTAVNITETYQGNTNLEQISDWLTKILIGAGLVELKAIYTTLQSFGSQFVKHKPLGVLGWIVAPALVISYSICGFLLAYLWARIYMIADLEKRKKIALGEGTDLVPAAPTTPPAASSAVPPEVGQSGSGRT